MAVSQSHERGWLVLPSLQSLVHDPRAQPITQLTQQDIGSSGELQGLKFFPLINKYKVPKSLRN